MNATTPIGNIMDKIVFLSYKELDYLNCKDCDRCEPDMAAMMPICRSAHMKWGCKRLLGGMSE